MYYRRIFSAVSYALKKLTARKQRDEKNYLVAKAICALIGIEDCHEALVEAKKLLERISKSKTAGRTEDWQKISDLISAAVAGVCEAYAFGNNASSIPLDYLTPETLMERSEDDGFLMRLSVVYDLTDLLDCPSDSRLYGAILKVSSYIEILEKEAQNS